MRGWLGLRFVLRSFKHNYRWRRTMTVTIELKCDGYNCFTSRELDADNDAQVERAGWGIDYKNGFHYCPSCWPIVQKELDNEDC